MFYLNATHLVAHEKKRSERRPIQKLLPLVIVEFRPLP